ncbi:MAG: hypothetical protein INR71_06595, partial [Terriglobus roseus]|nr:hypothetical protein [Terriglobus roseus]
MFRNPRENLDRPASSHLLPSTGRPPSPPATPEDSPRSRKTTHAARMPERLPTLGTHVVRQRSVKSTVASRSATAKTPNGKAASAAAAAASKKLVPSVKGKPNGSILNFFKKEEQGLFVGEGVGIKDDGEEGRVDSVWEEDDLYSSPPKPTHESPAVGSDEQARYNEHGGSFKRQKLGSPDSPHGQANDDTELPSGCTPPPPEVPDSESKTTAKEESTVALARKPTGPFAEDSDSDTEDSPPSRRRPSARMQQEEETVVSSTRDPTMEEEAEEEENNADAALLPDSAGAAHEPPILKREATSYSNVGDFEDFEGMADFEDDEYPVDGEEYQERKFMAAQRRLELADAGFEGDAGGFDDFPDDELLALEEAEEMPKESAGCPICSASLAGISDQDASIHVNNCLDGNPSPLPKAKAPAEPPIKTERAIPRFQKPVRPPKPGQENPIELGAAPGAAPTSAFSRLMSGHAEDIAWANAAAAEHASRGKPAFQRTCPFYKIMPGMSICVDAFRYGGVKDCRAYFLSHFHSDHYIGLTSSWSHGPIFASRVTNNLVRQQLRVDPKYVVDLEFDKRTEVPGTNGVFVTMIPANHCPGSSLFLFEKPVGKGKNPKVQRILHCGDFRACQAHLEHPLLKPDVIDNITGQTKQQKIDVCYLDTTYLNPKYAFPSQE